MMNRILHCDWLPERASWSYFARSGQPAVSQKKIFPESHNKSVIDQVCSVKMAGHCLALFSQVYGPRLRLSL